MNSFAALDQVAPSLFVPLPPLTTKTSLIENRRCRSLDVEQIGSFLTGRLLSTFGFKAAFYMHAVCSVPTLLILLRFNPKKEEVNNKEPPKFGELYQLVARDPDVMVSYGEIVKCRSLGVG